MTPTCSPALGAVGAASTRWIAPSLTRNQPRFVSTSNAIDAGSNATGFRTSADTSHTVSPVALPVSGARCALERAGDVGRDPPSVEAAVVADDRARRRSSTRRPSAHRTPSDLRAARTTGSESYRSRPPPTLQRCCRPRRRRIRRRPSTRTSTVVATRRDVRPRRTQQRRSRPAPGSSRAPGVHAAHRRS